MASVAPLTAKAAAELLDSVQYILLDVDGVVWSGSHVFPHIPQTIQYLRSLGKQIRFLSNNASLSRAELSQRFIDRGISGVHEREVYNSGYAAALRLKSLAAEMGLLDSRGLIDGNVFVIGECGLHDELSRVLAPGRVTYGLELHDMSLCGGYDALTVASAWHERTLPAPRSYPSGAAMISLADLDPIAVVAGLDLHFNMLKLAYASLCLQPRPSSGRRALFIATNEDPQIPVGTFGALMPGAGGMVAALAVVSGRRPDAVCGKPSVDMATALFAAEGVTDAGKCLMVGDRLTTDMAFGRAAGCRTMLVLTGVESLDDVAAAEREGKEEMIPEFVAMSLATFLPTELCD